MSVISRKYIAVPPLVSGGTYTLAVREVHHLPLREGIAAYEDAKALAKRLNTCSAAIRLSLLTVMIASRWIGRLGR